MTNALPRRRHIRLPRSAYAEPNAVCSVTIAVKRRARVFSDPSIAAAAVSALREHAARREVPIYAYCVMPDHVHLVLGPSPTCDIVTFVGEFKNLAQRAAWLLGVSGAFWQAGFWDHFLRHEERLGTVVDYVLSNPVRSGLVQRWSDYRFCGSPSFDGGGATAGVSGAEDVSPP
ncbi:transposase [Myxococcota bacterium]|nr:transposase [Myxococcota bacterium]